MTTRIFNPQRHVRVLHRGTAGALRNSTANTKSQYTNQKGFADDIGEGKMSLPLIHALGKDSLQRDHLISILQQRKVRSGLSGTVRKLAVDSIKATGGLEYALKTALSLQEAVDETLSQYEGRVGAKNWILRLIQKRLDMQE